MTRPLSDADYRSLARFRHALRRFERFSETAARRSGLPPAQHQLLLAIRGDEDPSAAALSRVAERLQLKVHSVGELAARAEAAGLVVRRADPADGRRTLLTLTPQGADKLAELSVLHRDELRRFRREMNEVLRELDAP